MFLAMSIISVLSIPISGLKTGRSSMTPLVTVMLSMVCEATCPKLSPVISAPQEFALAMRSAMRIINLRIMVIISSAGHFS